MKEVEKEVKREVENNAQEIMDIKKGNSTYLAKIGSN